MKEWQIIAQKNIQIVKKTIEHPQEGEVKVKVTKAALSSTDIAQYLNKAKKKYPIVPSRIASGLISEAYPGSNYKKGQRVLLNPYLIDKSNAKASPTKIMGLDVNGYLADFVIVPESCVFDLPDGVTDEEALFVEYIALGIKTLETLKIDKQDYVLIFGANALSNIIAQLSIYYKAIPIIVSNSEEKLKIAESNGIYYIINSDKENIKNKVKEITGGKYADSTVFACRAPQDAHLAFENTAYDGRVGIIGYNPYVNKISSDLRPILVKKLSVFGINSGTGSIESALNLLANKAIQIDGLINKTMEFEDVPMAFNESAKLQGKFIKMVINC